MTAVLDLLDHNRQMWLATVWYLADLVGIAESLGYRPRGVHRPEPAHDLGR